MRITKKIVCKFRVFDSGWHFKILIFSYALYTALGHSFVIYYD